MCVGVFDEVFEGFHHYLPVEVYNFHVSQIYEVFYFLAGCFCWEVSDEVVSCFHDYNGIAGDFLSFYDFAYGFAYILVFR